MARPAGISVQVGRIGTHLQDVHVPGNSLTVEEALEAADISPKDSESIRVNGSDRVNGDDVELDTELENNDIVMLLKGIDGGQ